MVTSEMGIFGGFPLTRDPESKQLKMTEDAACAEHLFFQGEIARWMQSPRHRAQLDGERYYRGEHDILTRRRTAIGANGEQEVKHLPNNRNIDNVYARMVDQKTNYLFGKPFTISTEKELYQSALTDIFDRNFHRILQNVAEDSINCGIGYLYVYYDESGQLQFKRLPPCEILPMWRDVDHTELETVIHVYRQDICTGATSKPVWKVEIFRAGGIEHYEWCGGVLTTDIDRPQDAYLVLEDETGTQKRYNWGGNIPIIAFKYNDDEIPLLTRVKSLQDALNTAVSDFQNNMQEDARNTLLVLKNYDGESLGEFRKNMNAYGVVKVRGDGGVDTLTVSVDHAAYTALIDTLKRAIIENAKGVDVNGIKSSAPNQITIKALYTEADIDANGMETEFQASFARLLWFVNAHLANIGIGDFFGESVDIGFNRDMLMNESDIINDCRNSVGLVSDETVLQNHPWVRDIAAENERLTSERGDAYSGFPHGENA